jgi:hypothetical protein
MPAFRKFMVMPPPIVPAPITAAALTGRVGVSSGTSGILAAARSAKNAWRSDADSVERNSSSNSVRSTIMPSSKGFFTAASTHSRFFIGAG